MYLFCTVCLNVLMITDINLICMRCLLCISENSFNFALPQLNIVCIKFLILWVIKLGCMPCLCSMNENFLTFTLCLLSIVSMNVLMISVIKLVCLSCFCNMNENITFVLSIWAWMKVLKVSVAKLDCNYINYITWYQLQS